MLGSLNAKPKSLLLFQAINPLPFSALLIYKRAFLKSFWRQLHRVSRKILLWGRNTPGHLGPGVCMTRGRIIKSWMATSLELISARHGGRGRTRFADVWLNEERCCEKVRVIDWELFGRDDVIFGMCIL